MLKLTSLFARTSTLRASSIFAPRVSPIVFRRGYSTSDDTFKTLLEEISSSIKPQAPRENRSRDEDAGERNRGGYSDDMGGYGGRAERSERGDRYGDRSARGERGDRSERYGDRSERGYGGDRGGYGGDRGGYGGDRGGSRGGYGGDRGGYGGDRGGYGGDRGGYGGRGGDRGFGASPMNFGGKLGSVDWNTAALAPVNKNFYVEHEAVKSISPEEAKAWRAKHSITIKGNGCPNPVVSFEHSPFPAEITQILRSKYEAPTPIQAQGWPLALSGRDMVGSSQTGSGKTLGFMLPALLHIQEQVKLQPLKWSDGPIALVLAPTRELAVQIIAEANAYFKKMNMVSTAVYGGSQRNPQVQALRQGVHMLVATPGRLIDFLSDGTTNLKRVSYVVMDEADRMLDMGFEPQIRQIMGQIRPDRQTLMWSATWPVKVQALAFEFFKDPLTIHVGSIELRANPNVTQNFHIVSEREKHQKVKDLVSELHKEGPTKLLVFCGTQDGTDRLSYALQEAGFNHTGAIHGGKSQQQRMHLLAGFRDGNINILVATDVAARGLDINNIQHVINCDFPNEIEDYIHRIGRTGRAGKTGASHTFLTHEKHPGKNALQLLRMLQDAGQKITDDLRQFSMGGGFSNDRSFGGGGGRRYGGRRY